MGNPVIAIDNMLDVETITASSEATGFEKENAFDGLVNDYWKPTAVPAWLKAEGKMPVGMWLGDTTEESLVGSEVCTDTGFDTPSKWTGAAWTVSGSQASIGGASGTLQNNDAASLIVGETYIAELEIISYTGGIIALPYDGNGLNVNYVSGVGIHQHTFTCLQPQAPWIFSSTFNGVVDNFKIRIAAPSLNANLKTNGGSFQSSGLGVHGTITKTAVGDSGLVAYSGFVNNTNYFKQPYNSDLDVGTGDFYYMGWIKSAGSGGSEWFLERADTTSNTDASIYFNASSEVVFRILGSAMATMPVNLNEWVFVTVVRESSVAKGYINGVLIDSTANSANLPSAGELYLGQRLAAAAFFSGSMSLWRAEGRAPTAAEILATYNKEKHYFKSGGTLPETLISTAATTADYFAMYGHDFAGSGSSVVLQYSDDDSSWTDAFDPIYPATSAPILVTFAQSSHKYWRTYVDGAVQQIGVLMFGVATEIERGLVFGFEPFALASENVPINSESANGDFLGRSTKKAPIKTQLNFDNIHQTWMRQYWPDLLNGLETKPFMILPQPGDYDEPAFCWSDGKIATPNYTSHDHMAFSMRVKARIK